MSVARGAIWDESVLRLRRSWSSDVCSSDLLSMPVITDVDGGRWRPVNEEALQEAIALLREKGSE